MKNGKLIVLRRNTLYTTSKIISEKTDYKYNSILKLIKEHENDLNEFGVFGFEITKPEKGSKGGRPEKIYFLNEEQTMLLIMCMKNTDKVMEFKIEITKEFFKMKKALNYLFNEKNTDEWKNIRIESKRVRLEETDTIKKLVEYAKNNGSKNAEWYYKAYSNLIWKHLFDVQIDCKDKRSILNSSQLHLLMQGEHIVVNTINDGIEKEIDYHDIYDDSKNKLLDFSKFIEITRVPYFEQVSLLN